MPKEKDDKSPMTVADVQIFAREKVAEMIAKWRADGLTDTEIEKKFGRSLPKELLQK